MGNSEPPLGLGCNEGLGPNAQLVERLRARRAFMSTDGFRWYATSEPDSDCLAAATEIERLRTAICIVREYPDFDGGGALPEMLDQVLRGDPAPMLDALDRLTLGPNVRAKRATTAGRQAREVDDEMHCLAGLVACRWRSA